MKPPRYTIANLMTLVAIAAVNFAALRTLGAIYARGRVDLLTGGAGLWVMVQLGASACLRNRGRGRASWAGVVGGGTSATLTFLAAVSISPLLVSVSYPRSVLGAIGRSYGDLIYRMEVVIVRDLGNTAMSQLTFVGVMTVAQLLPILLAAWAGGLLTRIVARPRGFDALGPVTEAPGVSLRIS